MGVKFNVGSIYTDGKKVECEWKECKPNTHPYKITYVKGGEVEKKYPYTGFWAHPSLLYTQKATLLYYPKNGGPPKPINRLNSYRIQHHHVIPANVLKKSVKTIAHNLKLLGWDMNNGNLNGMCLPWYDRDILWHDLQLHLGPHPSYDLDVKVSLKKLEGKCKKYCKSLNQEQLLVKIEGKVKLFKDKIKGWRVILNSRSPSLRNPSP